MSKKIIILHWLVLIVGIACIWVSVFSACLSKCNIDTSDIKLWCQGEKIDFRMTGATVVGKDENNTFIIDDRNIIHVIPYSNVEDNDFLLIWVDNNTGEVIKVWKEIYN